MAELVSFVVGVIVSVALEVVPNLKDKWSEWEWKKMTLFMLFMATPMVVTVLSCELGVQLPFEVVCDPFEMVCDQQGYVDAFVVGFMGFTGNQTAFLTTTYRTKNAKARNGNK